MRAVVNDHVHGEFLVVHFLQGVIGDSIAREVSRNARSTRSHVSGEVVDVCGVTVSCIMGQGSSGCKKSKNGTFD